MAKKTKKNYEFTTADGEYRFKVVKNGDGKGCDIRGKYPVICQTGTGIRKLSRKETEKWCLEIAIANNAFPSTPVVDGK